MDTSIWLWVGFNLFVLAMLALDLGIFHRKSHAVSGKEALIWSVVWISLSLVFNAVIYFFWDRIMLLIELYNWVTRKKPSWSPLVRRIVPVGEVLLLHCSAPILIPCSRHKDEAGCLLTCIHSANSVECQFGCSAGHLDCYCQTEISHQTAISVPPLGASILLLDYW